MSLAIHVNKRASCMCKHIIKTYYTGDDLDTSDMLTSNYEDSGVTVKQKG